MRCFRQWKHSQTLLDPLSMPPDGKLVQTLASVQARDVLRKREGAAWKEEVYETTVQLPGAGWLYQAIFEFKVYIEIEEEPFFRNVPSRRLQPAR